MSDPPPGMAPGRAKDLTDLAPAYIAVAGYDPLRDDGIRYGELLTAAGVEVEVHNAETMVHGYLGYAGVVPATTAALEARANCIAQSPCTDDPAAYGERMSEPTIARPGIDPTFKALLDAYPDDVLRRPTASRSPARGSSCSRCRRKCCRSCGPRTARSATASSPTSPCGSTGPTAIARRCPWSSSTTAAGSASATWTPTTRSPARTPSAPRPSWCPSATGWPRSIRFRRAWTTAGRPCNGSARTRLELGGDPNNIAVAGDSAGGNLAAVTALLARDNADKGGPALRFQLLWYPSVTADLSLPSYTENADAPILNRDVIDAFLSWYVPDLELSDPKTLPANMAPANAGDLSGLAPAYIATAEHDPLRDDGARYAELLAAAGVPVELSNEPTLVHGFVSFALAIPAAAEATERGLAALNKALHP